MNLDDKLNQVPLKYQKSILADIPHASPALVKALRIQELARSVGFDWQDKAAVWEKVAEEIAELQQCLAENNTLTNNQEQIENELGDLLFSLVNYARFINVNPEIALEKTNEKFINRFHYIEQAAQRDGKTLSDLSLADMDAYWEAAKCNLTK